MKVVLSFFVALSCAVAVFSLPFRDVILKPASSASTEACVIFIQGADIKPEQYIPLMKEIQLASAKDLKLWVGIPEFLGDMAFELEKGIERILNQLKDKGMTTDTIIMAGHSLGGAMVQTWTAKNTDKVKAQVLMGSFLTRAWKTDYHFKYPVPTLTIGGELDGLARVTRITEAFYTQLLDTSIGDAKIGSDLAAQLALVNGTHPVTVIEGITHMQFASGTPPDLVFKMDLVPEKSYAEAHTLIAHDFKAFMYAHIFPEHDEAFATMRRRVLETSVFIAPILDSLFLEGYHNFRPPCLCDTDICEPSLHCTARCPFTTLYSQPSMGGGVAGLTVNDTDSFHDVWETEPTVHLPSVLNSCAEPAGCQLDTTTVTQGAYHTGQDLEIWKKHFDVPKLDSGFLPITAFELKTKMNSRESIYTHAGVTDPVPDFKSLDGTGVRCGEINQLAIDWANKHAGDRTTQRFDAHGQKYVIGPDIDVCPAGPCWIWHELEFNESADGNTVEVNSPQFGTAVAYPMKKVAGFHYCKVLSPARVIEWMYVDGLRAKYSLRTYNGTTLVK